MLTHGLDDPGDRGRHRSMSRHRVRSNPDRAPMVRKSFGLALSFPPVFGYHGRLVGLSTEESSSGSIEL